MFYCINWITVRGGLLKISTYVLHTFDLTPITVQCCLLYLSTYLLQLISLGSISRKAFFFFPRRHLLIKFEEAVPFCAQIRYHSAICLRHKKIHHFIGLQDEFEFSLIIFLKPFIFEVQC